MPITLTDPNHPDMTITISVRPIGVDQIAIQLDCSSERVSESPKTIPLSISQARQLAGEINAELPGE